MARRLSLDGDARTAACLCGLGEVLRAKGNFKEAESYIRQSLMLCQQLYPEGSIQPGIPRLPGRSASLAFYIPTEAMMRRRGVISVKLWKPKSEARLQRKHSITPP